MNDKPVFVIFGNSSAEALSNIVRSVSIVSDEYDVVYRNSSRSTASPVVIDGDLAARLRIGWIQYDLKHKLDLNSIPPSADILTFPDLNCSALWPFHIADPLNFANGVPGGAIPYGDRAVIRLSDTPDLTADRLCAAYEAELATVDHDLLWAAQIQRWKQMDSSCQVQMTQFLTSHFGLRKLFLTPDHPTSLLLLELLRQILSFNRALSGAQIGAIAKKAVDTLSMEPFRAIETPVFRSVAKKYSLQWWDEGDHYASFDQSVTREQYLYNYYLTRRAQLPPATALEVEPQTENVMSAIRSQIARFFDMIAKRADH
ncbi:WcbI family polysaccharide biosynthesis putative acetyltransferase [Sphingobium sp. AN558]|uniref:WcbI family polysaccharide biosynthesis putative acetyltransferase n=1 Tax=Sphingobium sp. AN558 TaxID=3133442 RepID=UPI0030BCC22C